MIRDSSVSGLIFLAKLMRASFALAGLIWLAGCSPPAEKPLRVATIPWTGYESLHLAQSLSYFQPTQIRLTEMANASQVSLALRNGTIEAGFATLDEVLDLIQDGIDLRVIAVVDVSNGADAVMARPDIANLRALRGKRVAVENAAVGAIMLDAMLETSGLKVNDIELVSATVDDHLKLYLNGMVDATVTFEPVRSQLLKIGAHILFDSSRIPGRIMDVLVVRADQMAKHPKALKALLAAHFRALDYQAQQPQDAAKRIAPFLGVSENEVAQQYDGIKISSLAENYNYLSGAQPQLEPVAASLADLMLRHKLLQHAVSIDHLVEPMFLPVNKQ